MKNLITDFTKADFLDFATRIYNVDYPTDRKLTEAILEFERLSEHPQKSDLFFCPDPEKPDPFQ